MNKYFITELGDEYINDYQVVFEDKHGKFASAISAFIKIAYNFEVICHKNAYYSVVQFNEECYSLIISIMRELF